MLVLVLQGLNIILGSLRSKTAAARDKVTLGSTLFWLCGGSGFAVFDTSYMRDRCDAHRPRCFATACRFARYYACASAGC